MSGSASPYNARHSRRSQRKPSARDRAASVSAMRRRIISATGRISLIAPAVCPAVAECHAAGLVRRQYLAPKRPRLPARLLAPAPLSSRRHVASILIIIVVGLDPRRGQGIAHIDRDLAECSDMSQSGRTIFVADAAPVREGPHPATFAPATLILIVVLS